MQFNAEDFVSACTVVASSLERRSGSESGMRRPSPGVLNTEKSGEVRRRPAGQSAISWLSVGHQSSSEAPKCSSRLTLLSFDDGENSGHAIGVTTPAVAHCDPQHAAARSCAKLRMPAMRCGDTGAGPPPQT